MPTLSSGLTITGGLFFSQDAPAYDTLWSYVSYLMSTTAINGQQNNTFLDASTNNYSITRTGNTTQGAVSPYISLFSNYFSNSYLSVADSVDLQFGTGNFTVEGWVNSIASSTSTFNTVVGKWGTSFNTTGDWALRTRFSGINQVAFTLKHASGYYDLTTSTTANDGLWHHIAIVRDSTTTLKLFVDGVLKTTQNILATDIVGSNATMSVGSNAATNTNEGGYIGYLSNLRIVKGTALYTGDFTVPSAPLTAVANTNLLTCQSNRFIDNSGKNFTLTPTNVPAVITGQSPAILPSPGYTVNDNGGSGGFDGSGDYLSSSSWSAAGNFGTSDFTVECWVYATGAPQSNQVIWTCNKYPNTTGLFLAYYGSASNQLSVSIGNTKVITSSAGWSLSEWHHLAVVRSGTTLSLYIDGVSRGSTTANNNFTDGLQFIGRPDDVANSMMQGLISDFRIVKGTAVYTDTFTPPTIPLTAITNTSLLLKFTNAGVYDTVGNCSIETVGNAQVSTVTSKFGESSMYFDGTGDYISSPSNPGLVFGLSKFTIECWVNSSVSSSTTFNTLIGKWTSGFITEGDWVLRTRFNTDQVAFTVRRVTTFYDIQTNTSINDGNWHHIAVVRDTATTIKIFIDGVLKATQVISSAAFVGAGGSGPMFVGGTPYGTASEGNFIGYVDEVRITRGVARYTTDFTPPTAPFPVY